MKLKEQLLDIETDRNLDLINLMKICKKNAKVLNVVCVGAGDAFINRYWPTLQKYITTGNPAENTDKQVKIKLLVCDKHSLTDLVRDRAEKAKVVSDKAMAEIQESYNDFVMSVEKADYKSNYLTEIKYVDLTNNNEKKWYQHLSADIVFIIAPDDVHIKVATEWFRRATLIIVEKPYNRKLEEATDFEKLINDFIPIGDEKPITWVIPFDHYLAKIKGLALRAELEEYFESCGVLRRIEFQLTESRPLENWRAESLKEGLIYDLFSHILALLTICIKLNSFREEHIINFHVAKHENSPIEKETFAFVEFKLRDIHHNLVTIKGSIGKGISDNDEKFINFIGEDRSINCQFTSKKPGIFENSIIRYAIHDGHRELVEHILNGKFHEDPIGGLLGSDAIQIMKIMNSFREMIVSSRLLAHKMGSSPEEIIKIVGTKIK